jgi:hypothetical protein
MNDYLPRPWSVGGHRHSTLLYKMSPSPWIPVAVVSDSLTIKANGTIENGGDVKELMDRIKREDQEAARPRNRARYWIQKVREGTPSPRLTVEKILAEENQTVRLAMMRVFGFDRFVLQSNAKVIDEKAGYELLELPGDRWNTVKALKMKCSTSGAVYINQVPPHCREVPGALDWMFDVKDYLGLVTQQT